MGRRIGLALAVLALALWIGDARAADCSTPPGNEGDVIYNSTYKVVQFCNGTQWVNAGSSGAINVGTLTNGSFCTTDGSVINCTTAAINLTSQASGTLQAAQFPALTGDVTTSAGSLATTIATGAVTNAMLAGGIAASRLVGTDITTVGTITSGVWNAGAVTSSGTITGSLFAGSGASLTNLNAGNLSSGTVPAARLGSGSADSSTYLRGDGAWSTVSSSQWTTSGNTIYYNSGNVGIGTTSPGTWLVINNSTASATYGEYPALHITNPNTTGGALSAVIFGAGNMSGLGVAGVTGLVAAYANNNTSQQMKVYTAAETYPLHFSSGHSPPDMTILGNNVGIGTAEPADKLEVKVSSVGGIKVSGNDVVYIRLATDSEAAGGNEWYLEQFTGGALSFNLNGVTSTKSKLLVDTSGNIGIGTTSPGERLEVYGYMKGVEGSGSGAAAETWAKNLVLDSDGSVGMAFLSPNTQYASIHFGDPEDVDIGRIIYSHPGNFLGVVVNSAERLRITSSGNVGIGTASPATKLDVTGSIRASGEIISTNANPFRMVYGNYGAFFRNDGNNVYLLLTDSGDQYGGWNSLRPFRVNLASGAVTMNSTLNVTEAVTAVSFSGSGASLTALNADNLASGTVGTARLGSGTASSSTFLRGDQTWAAVSSSPWTTAGSSIYYNSGNVGIGTTSPGERLDVYGYMKGVEGSGSGAAAQTWAKNLVLDSADSVGMAFLSPNTQYASIHFGDPEDADIGRIAYSHSDNHMQFVVNGAERLRITSSGNVGIGTTGPNVKLDVAGPIVSRVYNAGASTVIDWSNSNVAYTSASCGSFTFSNMQDGGTYTLFVQGTTSATCSFAHSGLTVKLPPGHGATTGGTMTVYGFTRAGNHVFATWVKGY